jgi:hypothetical protein
MDIGLRVDLWRGLGSSRFFPAKESEHRQGQRRG